MEVTINCFIPYQDKEQIEHTVNGLKQEGLVNKIYLLTIEKEVEPVHGCTLIKVNSLTETAAIQQIAAYSDADYTLIYTSYNTLALGLFALERMVQLAADTQAAMVYADYYQVQGETCLVHPLIDYQFGSLRNDFDFGPLLLYRASALAFAVADMVTSFRFAGLYDLRLRVSEPVNLLRPEVACFHIKEYLYSEVQPAIAMRAESLFDYVDPKNREVQQEMEVACTAFLKRVGGYLRPEFETVSFDESTFEYEASVIIPVRNRKRTIDDAIRSVLIQKTTFKFNLIIIDNHSTDGTTELINQYASDPRLIHLTPTRQDLGIGGCWNFGVHHKACGKFAIQLDSDDVYSDENTLQKMVDAFYAQHCAMVVGTYRMTDIDMNTISPGIIDHSEWTPENGRNNALRINGLGAPRGFYTPLLREIKMPNTCYGEDYALGLAFSRHYQIGRIYEVLYLCRRWEDNSDAQPDLLKMNTYNTYKDSIRTSELIARIRMNTSKKITPLDVTRFLNKEKENRTLVRVNYQNLEQTRTRELWVDGHPFLIQYNPERIRSTGASAAPKLARENSCFLCEKELPIDQSTLSYNRISCSQEDRTVRRGAELILVNPYPVFPEHLTIVSDQHVPQEAALCLNSMLDLARELPGFTFFYNGAKCGASVPEHAHFQAGTKGILPIEQELASMDKLLLYAGKHVWAYSLKDGLRTTLLIESDRICTLTALCYSLLDRILWKDETHQEQKMNILVWYTEGMWRVCIFFRSKHRPACYGKEERHFLISPASVEMAGLFVMPREEDFERITAADIKQILKEVSYDAQTMEKLEEHLKTEISYLHL